MSLFRYFEPIKDDTSNVSKQASSTVSKHASSGALGVSGKEAIKVAEELKSISTQNSEAGKTSRTQYAESLLGILLTNFDNLTKAALDAGPRYTNLSWFNKKAEEKIDDDDLNIGLKDGRPTLLSFELDAKLRTMIQNMRISGAPINIHTVRGVQAGLVCSDVEKYGQYLDFQVTRPWMRSLCNHIKMSRRVSTTSRPTITRALWEEISTQYLHEISSLTKTNEIPDELILNLDQTSSKFLAASKVTMAEKRSKYVPIAGGTDKRCITLTETESISGQLLPLQVIFKGKTERCLPPKARDDKRFLFPYNEEHWSNNKETLRLIDGILLPYIEKNKKGSKPS